MGKLLLVIFSFLAYGQAFAACSISFTAAHGANGGQVTFEAANSQYIGQPARYKYLFSASDNTNCGNAGIFGLSNADGSSNINNTGVTTGAGIMLQSSAKGSSNMFVHSTNNGGPNDFNAFYYSIPSGLSNTTDTFQFFDGNVTLQTATVTIPVAVPGVPTIGTATAGNQQASVTFSAPSSDGGSPILDYTVTSNPGGFTATGAGSPLIVTGLTNGTAYTFTVTARNVNGSGTASSASASVTPKAPQTISFANPGAQTFGTTPTLTASSTSGLTPVFSTATASVCTITGNTLTFLTAGSCKINADEAGNGTYLPATTVQQIFTVNPVVPGAPTAAVGTAGGGQVSVAFTEPVYTGGSAIIDYTVTASPGGASATSAASPIAVTGLTNGAAYTFTVTARNAAGSGPASSASAAVTPKASQTITFANPGSQNFGTTPTLTASASSGLTPAFSSSTAGVCTITSGGALTFITAGNCTIHADQAGDSTFGAATTISRTFTVNAVVPGAPTGAVGTAGSGQVSVAFTAPAFKGGSLITGYTATASPGGATVSGAASPLVVTGLANGTAYTFTVTATNSAGTGAASVATAAVSTLSSGVLTFATPGTASATMGSNFTNIASSTLSGGSYGAISYSSSNTAVATVNASGVVTPVSVGTSTITATQAAVVGVNAQATQSYLLTVVKNTQATLNAVSDKATITKVTGTANLSTTGGSGSGTVSYAVTTGGCTVAGSVLTAGSIAETCVITATKAADANYDAATAMVSVQVLNQVTSTVTLASSLPNPVLGQSVTLTATVVPGAATGTISFRDGATVIGSVNVSGGVASMASSTLAVGSHNLTAVYSGDADTAGATSSVLVVGVNARPDPVNNPVVTQNIAYQAATTQRFTTAQMANIYSHVQMLRGDFNVRNRFGVSLTAPHLDTLRMVGGKILENASGATDKGALTAGVGTPKTADDQRRAKASFAREGMAYQQKTGLTEDDETAEGSVVDSGAFSLAGMPAGIWTAGNIDVGSLEVMDGSLTKFSSTGLTLGMDVKASSKWIVGASLGYAKDKATFDSLGSESRAEQWSGSVYLSYKPKKQWFIDGVLGAGQITYDNRRWDSTSNVLLDGDRRGKVIYGSLNLTREMILQEFRVHPFGRMDVFNVKLDSYSEQGSAMALTFKDSSFTNAYFTGGLDISKDYVLASGQWTPSLKLQLSSRTSGDVMQSMYYTDMGPGAPVYNATVTGIPNEIQSLGLGLNYKSRGGLQANVAWLGSMGANVYRANSLRFALRYGF